MTVAKGTDWGERGPCPVDTVEVESDSAARRAVGLARRRGVPPPPLRLQGGDLYRTIGSPRPAAEGAEALLLPIDLGVAELDGVEEVFVAHLLARHSWWRGRLVAVMNAQFRGAWDVAPRSHPNDGRLDVVDVAPGLTLRDRWRARRRLPSGTHVPHPSITVRPHRTWTTTFERPTPVWLDGEPCGTVTALSVRVEPDAVLVVAS